MARYNPLFLDNGNFRDFFAEPLSGGGIFTFKTGIPDGPVGYVVLLFSN